jgi:ABC-type sugar transport system permease subunit
MSTVKITCRNLGYNFSILFLLLPTIVMVAAFSYTPALEAIRHSLYVWDGDYVEEFVGLKNFRDLIGDLGLWAPLLVGALCSFISALAPEGKKRKMFRIAGAIGLIAAACFFLVDYRTTTDKVNAGTPFTVLSILLTATVIFAILAFRKHDEKLRKWSIFFAYFLPVIGGLVYIIGVRQLGDWLLWMSFKLIFILIIANLFKMWPSIFTAVCVHRLRSERWQYIYRVLFVIPMIIPGIVMLLIWKFFYDPNVGFLNQLLMWTRMDRVLIWLDSTLLHWGVFNSPFKPVWLGEPDLVIPALIFWGFPWVGVVGVLIYLSGLQNISQSVYEAADIDGVNSWGKFTYIELPLIMTQIRLTLIMMVIGTFKAYGFQLMLLGAEGGPRNKGLTPGLYMFYKAFLEQEYGYACAIGMLLFVIILVLTIVNQKFVRSKTN